MRNRALLVCLLTAFILQWLVLVPSTSSVDAANTTQKSEGRLADAILGSVRSAKPGQFPTADAAVSFLLEQVKQQDIDEAARAFPIMEFYERQTFEGYLRHYRIVDPGGPFPDQHLLNVFRALRPLHDYIRTSVALLGQPYDQHAVIYPPVTDEKVAEMVEKYDFGKLRRLNVAGVKVEKVVPMPPEGPAAKLLGITHRAELVADVAVDDEGYRLKFSAIKLADNWYVERMEGASKES
jgi:hypothetical protein